MVSLPTRTRLFIQRRFQIRYIATILAFMLIAAVLSGYTVYVTTWIMFGEKLAAVYPQGLLLDMVSRVNNTLILRLLLVTPLVILIALVLSSRIAGPIYRIKRCLKRAAAGNYETNIELRQKDELQDVADLLNSLVSGLRRKERHRNEELDILREKIEELKKAVSRGQYDRKDALSKVAAISEELESLRE